MNWDKLRIFHAVAEAGSLTRAGDQLHLSQSAVSRQITALEESLGVSLFHRHARGLILTEQGEHLFKTVHEIFAKIEMTEAQLRDSKQTPRGDLRVTTTVAFGSTWLTRRIGEFIERYPEIKVHIIVADHELDIGMREADCAIRFHPPQQPHLIQRQLVVAHYHIYGSRRYLERHGAPATASDLDDHALIVYGPGAPAPLRNVNWIIKAGPTHRLREPVLRINNIYGILNAVESGVGLAALPDYLVRGRPDLVRVLPDLEGPNFVTYFVYPEELRDSVRIGVFRDFLISKVGKTDL